MCQTFAEGNLKCAECTRPLYDGALAAYLDARSRFDPNATEAQRESAAAAALGFLREAVRPFSYSVDGLASIATAVSRAAEERDAALARVLADALDEGRAFYEAWFARVHSAA